MRFLIGKWTIWGAWGSRVRYAPATQMEQFEATSESCRLFLFWEGLVGFFFPEEARSVFA